MFIHTVFLQEVQMYAEENARMLYEEHLQHTDFIQQLKRDASTDR